MENKKFDFAEAKKEIDENPKSSYDSTFFQPSAGKHKIRILSAPIPLGAKSFETGKPPKERMAIEIEEDGKKFTWTMNKTKGEKGNWVKFITLGAYMQKEGKDIVGSTITLLVTGEGKTKGYEFLELYDYINKDKQKAVSPSSKTDVEAFL